MYAWNPHIHQKVYKAEAKSYLQNVALVIQLSMRKNLITPFDDYFYLDLDFYLPRRNSDSHNYLKLLMDVLQHGGLVTDDRYILNRTQSIKVDKLDPRVILKFKQ